MVWLLLYKLDRLLTLFLLLALRALRALVSYWARLPNFRASSSWLSPISDLRNLDGLKRFFYFLGNCLMLLLLLARRLLLYSLLVSFDWRFFLSDNLAFGSDFLYSGFVCFYPVWNLIGKFTQFRCIECIIMKLRGIYFWLCLTSWLSSSLLSSHFSSEIFKYFDVLVILFQLFLSLLDGKLELTIDFGTFVKLSVFE